MGTKFVKFFEAKRWAQPNAAAPQFTVTENEIVEVSDEMAMVVCDSGNGEVVENPATDSGEDEVSSKSEEDSESNISGATETNGDDNKSAERSSKLPWMRSKKE